MKIKYKNLIALSIFALVPNNLSADTKTFADASGHSSSSSFSKSVSITSEGGKTIKKTVITRDGVKETITEITGKNGKKTVTKEGGEEGADNENAEQENPEGEKKPWIGVRVKELSPAMRNQLGLEEDEGVEVDLLAKDSPATEAGIQVGDLLLSFAGAKIANADDLLAEINRHQAGETVPFTYMRGGKRFDSIITIQERSDKAGEKPEGQEEGEGNDKFDAFLDDPNVPEDFKKKMREMMKKTKERQEKAPINVTVDGQNFDAILNDPNIPESFKETVREMLEKLDVSEKEGQ